MRGIPIYDIRNVSFLAFQGTEVTIGTGDVLPLNSYSLKGTSTRIGSYEQFVSLMLSAHHGSCSNESVELSFRDPRSFSQTPIR